MAGFYRILAFLTLAESHACDHHGGMTTTLAERQAVQRPLTGEETDELCALTAHLPQLVRGWSVPIPVGLADAALWLDAAMWDAARRFDVDLCATCTVFDVVDGLSRRGWSSGPARDALRAFVMLRWAPQTMAAELAACRAAGRLLAYLELRTRFG
jgi:hypothetical protein